MLDQILKNDEGLSTDHFLNKDQGESRPEPALADKACLKLLLQIVGLEVIGVVFVPLSTLPPVPFPFALSVRTSLLAIFESWMRHKPAPTDPARASLPTPVLLHGSLPLIPLRENLPHKTQGLCHSSCRYGGRSPTEEKHLLCSEIRVQIDQGQSQWKGMKRSKRILQTGWKE
jgi:hypothetical protein